MIEIKTGQNVGYVRVSTVLQNEDRQLEGLKLDIIFTDKLSGKDRDRPQLKACINHLRAGDTLHIHSIDRLARNLQDLQAVVKELTQKGVTVSFHKENLSFTGESNPMNILMLQVMGACAEFELQMIKERQREGIAIAQKKGVQIGRKAALTSNNISEVKTLWNTHKDKSKIADILGVSRVTFYSFLKKHQIELN